MIKMTNKKMMLWAAAVLVVSLCVGVKAFAFGPRQGGFGMGALMNLDLTDDQKKEVAAIFEKYQPKGDELREKLRPFVMDHFSDDAFDEAKARVKYKEAAPLFEEMYILKQKIKNDIRGVLTEEQIAQLKEKRDRCKAKAGERKKCRKACMKAWLEPETE